MAESSVLPWQSSAWARVTSARRAGRLPHSLLIVGPKGVGKRNFARRLSSALECETPDDEGVPCGHCRSCQLTLVDNHPDIVWLSPGSDEKTIKIDAVRRLTEQSVLAAEGSGYRVFVIEPAEAMSQGAANALLKTLEEPASRSLLLLVSSYPSRLPATIRSRCQVLSLGVPTRDLALAWLTEQQQGGQAECALGLAGGAPLLALEFAHQGVVEQVATMADRLRGVVKGEVDPMAVAADWQNLSPDFFLRYLQQWVIDLIRLKHNENPPLTFHAGLEHVLVDVAERANLGGLFDLLDQLTEFRRVREHNLNPLLMLEKIMITCNRFGFLG